MTIFKILENTAFLLNLRFRNELSLPVSLVLGLVSKNDEVPRERSLEKRNVRFYNGR